MKRLCTICARGGSKGVPSKNLRLICGRPLIAWTIMQAKASGLFDHIVVSSDAKAILTTAVDSGADAIIVRPDGLASDVAAKVPAIRHAVLEAERQIGRRFDVVADLDVTAPLRLPEDIVGAVKLLEERAVSSVVTGAPARRSPYFNLLERNVDGSVRVSKPLASAVIRRQDAPACFDMNASIYAWPRDNFVADPRVFYPNTLLYEMPAERSHDIDTEVDFMIVDFLFEKLRIADGLSRKPRG